MDTPAPKQFGRYEIVGELGRGAMGVVFRARDPHIERTVALKTVTFRGQEPDEEKEFRRRFLNEAQAAGRLHHPGIVSVFDVGEDPETKDPFLVMEYVAGEALNRKLAREKKIPLDQALQLAEEIASALDYAHAQGVTHRDIKPGNILITPDGRAKIADFGIAKLNLSQTTLPGRVLGTPAYMAPEQLSGEGADGRSDLFSLGVILYAMVTGHSPFQGNSATTVCFKVANREPVPASAMDIDLPRELDAIIGRAMEKNPEKRFQSGAEFAEAIAELRERVQPAPATGTRASTRARAVAPQPTLSGDPAVGMAYAVKVARAAMLKAPVKDIVLGVATIVMLLIVGVQTKLIVLTHEEGASADKAADKAKETHTEQTAQLTPAPQPAPLPAQPVPVHTVSAKARAKAPTRKAVSSFSPPAAPSPDLKVVSLQTATVELAIRHQFKEATLTVWVDGKVALTRPLHGGQQKRLGVFNNGVRGSESETLQIPAGQHTLRLQAESADQTVNLSKTIAADLSNASSKTLQITFDKHNTAMNVSWQ